MKKKYWLFILVIIFLCLFCLNVNATTSANFEEDSIIVTIKKEYSEVNKIYSIEDFNYDNIKEIEDLTLITGDINDKALLNINEFKQILKISIINTGIEEVNKAIEIISNLNFVDEVSPNYIISLDENVDFTTVENYNNNGISVASDSNDMYFYQQYALNKIEAPSVWNFTTGSSNLYVGVIDSGIDITHPDLANNVHTGLGINFVNDGYNMWQDPNGMELM